MHGILVIDKPGGMTSHDVVRRVRRLLGMRRVGHTGTLDPLATGVLPVAIGEGTRLVQFLLEKDKDYRATLCLGVQTDTQDAAGATLERRPVGDLDRAQIETVARTLSGDILQVPPMYSALKKDGVPLHKLARQGIEIERPPRPVTVYRFEILAVRLPEVEIAVSCSKGTYVRTLAHDLGLALGCGAHLTALRRTRSGPFDEDDCLTLEALTGLQERGEALPLLGPRTALPQMAAVEVAPEAALRLSNGIPPESSACSGLKGCQGGDEVLLMGDGRVLAIARYAPLRQRERRGDFELLRVFSRPELW